MVTRLVTALTCALAAAFFAPSTAPAYDFDWAGRVELDADGLKANSPKDRLRAVQALSKYDIDRTAEHLLRALNDSDSQVRFEAGRVLGRKGVVEVKHDDGPPTNVVAIVAEWLEEPDSSTKRVAAGILADLATDEAITALIRTLSDVDPGVRLRAVTALGKIGTEAVVIPLVGRLEDDKSDVRKAAVEQLKKIRDRRAVIPLVGTFNDASLDVRKAAVEAVGHLGDDAAVPALIRLLDDQIEEIKINAVSSLGNLMAVEAIDTLIEHLGGGSDAYRGKVAFALGQIAKSPEAGAAGKEAVRALVAALANGRLRIAATEALRNAGPAAVDALVAHLEGELDGDPATAVILLRDIGDKRATPALVAELDRGRISTELVLDALSQSGDARALVPVLGLLSEADSAVRMLAMNALRPLLQDDARAADVMVKMLDDESFEIRVLAAEYLGAMHSRRAVPALIDLTEAGNKPRLRAAAIDALGEIQDERASRPLLELLRDGPTALHPSVANALIYIADESVVDALVALASDSQSRSRHHVIRALGGTLRGRSHDGARETLEKLATDDKLRVSLAAIAALGAMGDANATPALIGLAKGHQSDLRRAAIATLGDLGDQSAVETLLESARVGDDRTAGDAVWALGKLDGAANIDALFKIISDRRGWATTVNASAVIAMHATDTHAERLIRLLHHKNRLVRVNAAAAAGRLELTGAVKSLTLMLESDPSYIVRIAAARALSLTKGGDDALARAADADREPLVKQAAAAVIAKPFAPPERTDWRNFYFVDPGNDDAPVKQEPYFVVSADGIAKALYTDARGEHADEWFPPGDHLIAPKSRLVEY